MGTEPAKSETIRAGENVVKIDAGSMSAAGDININLAGAAPASRPRSSTVPTPSPTFVPRKNITKKIHKALASKPKRVVVRQAVTRAMGGYGKTVAAILYAHEYARDYPGGRFFLLVESADLVTALASLVTPLGLTSANDPKADAARVSQTLKDGPACLLILDNVASKAAWEAMLASGLVPRGSCRLLVTTRDDAIDPADAIKVERLEPAEAREVYRLFCDNRRDKVTDESKRATLPAALPSDAVADAITAWLGGLAVSVAAVAAYMKLKPRLAWDAYWNGDGGHLRGLTNTPVAELPDVKPDVAAQLGLNNETLPVHRRTLQVIDDAFEALPAPERRAVEYAALLPHDLAPANWLESLLEADKALALTTDPDDDQSPARAVLYHLDELDILLRGGEGGQLLSLHRLWHARVNERAGAAGADGVPLLDAVEFLIYELEERWVGSSKLSAAWSEVISLHVLSERLSREGRSTARIAARTAIRRVFPSLPSPHEAIQAQALAVAQAVRR